VQEASRGAWRSPLRYLTALLPVLVDCLAATVLLVAATAALVFGVAWVRAAGGRGAVAGEAARFASSGSGIVAGALVSAAVLAFVALTSARLETRNIWTRLRLRRSRASALGSATAVVGMIGLSLAGGAASELTGVRGHGTMEVIAGALRDSSPLQRLLAVVAIGLAPGLAEEAFFRGLIQPALAKHWARWPSIAGAAVAFGLVHFDAVQGSLAFFAGLFLGWVAERFDGIRPGVAAHAINNALFVVLASVTGADDATRAWQGALLAVGLISAVGAIAFLRSPRALRRSA
jgi:membrane protease YdiL (CAAX protease family)